MYPKVTETFTRKGHRTPVFTAARSQEPRCASRPGARQRTDAKRSCGLYTRWKRVYIKNDGNLPFTTTRMDPEVVYAKWSQAEKDRRYPTSITCGILETNEQQQQQPPHSARESKAGGCQRQVRGGNRGTEVKGERKHFHDEVSRCQGRNTDNSAAWDTGRWSRAYILSSQLKRTFFSLYSFLLSSFLAYP